MGIYDRDYSRAPAPRGPQFRGPGSPRAWSVTTWLIVSCVLVFMINLILPQSYYFPSDWEPFNVNGQPPTAELMAQYEKAIKIQQIPEGTQLRTNTIEELGVFYAPEGSQPKLIGRVAAHIQGYPWIFGYFSTATALFDFSPVWGVTGFEFWRFISFQFLHANMEHLLFNMIGLFFFGAVVEQYLGKKRYLAFYLLCGIAGACMYLLLNFMGMALAKFGGAEAFPFLLSNDPRQALIGASAGVFGVILAAAYLMPNATVLLFFVFPMRLKTLAYGIVLFAFAAVFFGFDNAGGQAAHLGGAMAGFYFIRRPHHLHGFFDFMGRVDPTSRSAKARRAGNIRAKGKPNVTGGATVKDEIEIDRILAKIHDRGLQSLNDREKKILREASRR